MLRYVFGLWEEVGEAGENPRTHTGGARVNFLYIFFFAGSLALTGRASPAATAASLEPPSSRHHPRKANRAPPLILSGSELRLWLPLLRNGNRSAPSWTRGPYLPAPSPLPRPQHTTQLGSTTREFRWLARRSRRRRRSTRMKRAPRPRSQPPTEMQRPLLVMLPAFTRKEKAGKNLILIKS